ncbi:MAG: HAMP domain-containing histidine kinase, partial [Burkholderiales bacterium]|nr:HAMP domain-containing histidine kinase [Burkholderiales bacterium]
MRSLYLRIYLTVVAVLALFALVSGWVLQHHLTQESARMETAIHERIMAWGELLERAMPPADAPRAEQRAMLQEWSHRLRVPMALDDAQGRRIAATPVFVRRELGPAALLSRVQDITFADGRVLHVLRGVPRPLPWRVPGGFGPWPDGLGLSLLLLALFVAVAAGAWPVVRHLTRRLESLKRGVEAFGAGALSQRVAEDGRDEVAALGASFNRAAARIEALLRSHQSLLANASHELRSPLARLKMAVAMIDGATEAQRPALRREIDTDIAELDALVEEVLLASRLDGAANPIDDRHPVDLLGVAAEEASRVGAAALGDDVQVPGEERLLRRALRNLLENARRYGGDEVEIEVRARGAQAEVAVRDRGPGVPEAHRERIFEAFFRLPGHAEREGGVGLGLSLVRQIAERHGGSVRCEPREGGGSSFVLRLPLRRQAAAGAAG